VTVCESVREGERVFAVCAMIHLFNFDGFVAHPSEIKKLKEKNGAFFSFKLNYHF